MATSAKFLTIGEANGLNQRAQPLLGGEGGTLLEADNLSFFQDGGLVQRFGSATQALSGFGFTGIVEWLGRHTTTGGVEELWGAANNAGTAALGRRPAGVRSSVAFSDTAVVSDLRYMQAASLTSKYFITYNSDVNRTHVWDGTSLRRVGFGRSPAVTAATMGGSGKTWNRWYRKRLAQIDASGTVQRVSEPSVAPVNVSITDDTGVTITMGALLGEGETHWIAEAADDDGGTPGTFFQIATTLIATTTVNDTSASLLDFDISPLVGEYIPPPSAKYILTDTNRLLYAGAWELTGTDEQTAPKSNRVWFTPVLGSTDEGDDERIPNTVDQQNWVDVGNEGPITALAGPLYGDIYVLKDDSIFKLTPTGDFVTPYRVISVMSGIGAVDQRVVCNGQFGTGQPAIFFASSASVYAITSGGIIEVSDEVSRDLRMNNFTPASSWLAYDPYDKCLRAQTNSGMSAVPGQYYQFSHDFKAKRWSGMSLGGAMSGWVLGRSLLGIDTILGGGGSDIRNTVVALNDNGSVRLLLGGQNSAGASQILACGDVCGVDGATAFTSAFRIRKFPTPGKHFRVGAATIIYRSPTGTSGAVGTMTLSFINEKGVAETKTKTLDATPQDDPLAQKVLEFDGLQKDLLKVFDLRVTLAYDISFATAIPPSIDAFFLPITEEAAYVQ